MNVIHMINLSSVGVFGILLSAAFCETLWTRQKRLIITGCTAVILILQGIIYIWIDPDIVEYIYPLITHIPLILVLWALTKKCLWSIISVLTAYLCCQPRRWFALLIVDIFSGSSMMQDIVELILTLPLLLLLIRYIAPSIRFISHYTLSAQWHFGLVPILYYCFDYLTCVYTNLLLEGGLVVAEFMPFVCSAVYLVFVSRLSTEERNRIQLEQTEKNLNLQITQAIREIKTLRELQQKTSTYRHDLRHHMQYLSSCIEHGRLEQAQGYIHEICSEIETNKITVFCENETANLIFSAFASRAADSDIPIRIQAEIPRSLPLSENDLCVLLSNALENALHACQKRKKHGQSGEIEVSAYEKKGKFFLQIMNSCDEDIRFEQGIPLTDNPGHGIGVRSICTIVEQNGGIYTFSAKDNRFVLRISF